MFDRLGAALALVTEEFEDSVAGGCWLSDVELAERVEAAQRVANAVSAVQLQRVAQYAAREDVHHEDGTWGQQDRGLGHVSEFAAGVIGPRLGLGAAAADAKVGVAARLAGTMRPTLRLMAQGDLDEWRATVLVRELSDAEPEVVAAVEERVLERAPQESARQIRQRARRELARIDPDALLARVRRARDERGLWRRPGEPGVSEWLAVLPAEASAQCWAAVDELARRYRADGDARTLDQARADALTDLVLGHATVTTSVTFAVPAVTAGFGTSQTGWDRGHCAENTWRLPPRHAPGVSAQTPLGLPASPAVAENPGHEDNPGDKDRPRSTGPADLVIDVPGVGEVPADVVRALSGAFGTKALIALCDWQTGTLASQAREVYRPPAWLDRFVKARDGTCRFPGCTIAATRCDTDHVIAAPAGPTSNDNLMSLCRHHHRLKQQPRWQVEITADGVVTWTTPVGDRFVTWPVDHLGTRDALPHRATADTG